MSKIKRINYFTKEKKDMINPANLRKYKKYLTARISSNKDVRNSTYKTYENYFTQFLVYLAEEENNIDLYSDDFQKEAVEIMEGFMMFCQDTLHNNKKVINTKISAVSSFFHWAARRGNITHHPFDNKLERMKGARQEKIIAEHFLRQDQVDTITKALAKREDGYDIIDQLVWGIMIDSANRIGAIHKLTLSSLDLEQMKFDEIREKRGEIVEVIFNEGTKGIIEEWLEMRKDMDNLKIDALFISKYGGEYTPMHKKTLQARVKKIGKIIGLDDFRSHSIRKTAVNLAYEVTGDIAIAAELANHKSIDTTQQSYIQPKSKTALRDKLNEAKKNNS